MNVVYTFNQSDPIKNMRVDVDDIVYCNLLFTIEKIPPISQSHGPNVTREHFWPGGDFFPSSLDTFHISQDFYVKESCFKSLNKDDCIFFMPYFVHNEVGGAALYLHMGLSD